MCVLYMNISSGALLGMSFPPSICLALCHTDAAHLTIRPYTFLLLL